jgi:hypothetical protein
MPPTDCKRSLRQKNFFYAAADDVRNERIIGLPEAAFRYLFARPGRAAVPSGGLRGDRTARSNCAKEARMLSMRSATGEDPLVSSHGSE